MQIPLITKIPWHSLCLLPWSHLIELVHSILNFIIEWNTRLSPPQTSGWDDHLWKVKKIMKNVIGKYNRLYSLPTFKDFDFIFKIVSELLHLWAGLGKPSPNCWFWVFFFGFLGQDSSILLHLGHFYQTAPIDSLINVFFFSGSFCS